MHPLDQGIVVYALGGFLVFFVLQMIVFRLFHQEAVLKAIMLVFVAASGIHVTAWLWALAELERSFGSIDVITKVLIVVLSYGLFGLMAFVYILCVFGPSETSIRIRIVREIGEAGGQGLSRTELLARYNARMVLERRLERLTRSGEIVLREGRFVLVKKANFFFMIDAIANAIGGLIRTQ